MQYTLLPTTDLKISKACLGTMSFGAHVDEKSSQAIMDRSLELGINFFDTAEMYAVPTEEATCGLTEKIIGRWMADRGNRDQVMIATKVIGRTRSGLEYIRDGKACSDESNIREAIEGSLQRLQTDYIDLYQLHWPDRAMNRFGQRNYIHQPDDTSIPIEETLEVLQTLQKEGKVKHFGLSNESPWGTMQFLQLAKEKNLPRMVSVQNNYSLLTRSYDTAMAEVSHKAEIPLLAYSPLGFGVLGGRYLDGNYPEAGRFTKYPDCAARYRTPKVEAIIKQYKTLAESHGLTLPQMALAFVYSRSFLASNIIGPSNVEQLEDCVSALDIKLNDEILKDIEAIHEQCPNPCP